MTLPASGAIAFSCINTELCRSSTAQLSMNCSSVRTLFGQASGAICMNTGHGKSNTTVPGAPTSVGGSATSSSAISVTFSAPASNGGLSIDLYQAISSPGCFTATAASSPISVTGLSPSTAYTFRVRAHNSKGYGCYSSSSASVSTTAVRGCSTYTTPGSYTFYKPAGVTYVSAIVQGGGGDGARGSRVLCYGFCDPTYRNTSGRGGGSGGLAWINNFCGTSNNGYSVIVPSRAGYAQFQASTGYGAFANGGSTPCAGSSSYSTAYPGAAYVGASAYYYGACSYGSTFIAGGGGAGAVFNSDGGCGGGGGTSTGGQSGSNSSGKAGANGGAGGGASSSTGNSGAGGGGGGGIGLYGKGANGAGGTSPLGGGGGGSGGSNGDNGTSSSGGNGGSYGGGGGGGTPSPGSAAAGLGASGFVRIIWPGNTRSWPSTDVGA
jgi:hypothetical protein